jgi:ABC-2 type transport system ATP-binding protein
MVAGTAAVHDVSFTVPAGQTVALVGPAGAGKTTLVRTLLGLTAPVSGTFTVAASDAGRAVGALLQPRGLQPARTVRGQVRIYAAAAGVCDKRADALLAATGLDGAAGIRVRSLSTGQQTRLALAIALLGDPALLVLDDPLAGLEASECRRLFDLLRRHTRRGGSIVLTAQSLAAVVPITDELIVLSAGSVAYRGSPRRLRRSHPDRTIVASSSPIALATALAARGFTDTVMRADGRLAIADASGAQIQEAATAARVQLGELIPEPVHPDRVLAALTRTTAPTPTPYGTPR